MDLTVGNAVSRQDIRYGMGFREKILQRFAALDIEFRNIGFLESFFLLGLEALFMGFPLRAHSMMPKAMLGSMPLLMSQFMISSRVEMVSSVGVPFLIRS